jgi:hypothetical protein
MERMDNKAIKAVSIDRLFCLPKMQAANGRVRLAFYFCPCFMGSGII